MELNLGYPHCWNMLESHSSELQWLLLLDMCHEYQGQALLDAQRHTVCPSGEHTAGAWGIHTTGAFAGTHTTEPQGQCADTRSPRWTFQDKCSKNIMRTYCWNLRVVMWFKPQGQALLEAQCHTVCPSGEYTAGVSGIHTAGASSLHCLMIKDTHCWHLRDTLLEPLGHALLEAQCHTVWPSGTHPAGCSETDAAGTSAIHTAGQHSITLNGVLTWT